MRKLEGPWLWVIRVIGIVVPLFLIFIALSLAIHTTAIVFGFIGLGLVTCFMLYPFSETTAKGNSPTWVDIILMILSIIVCGYPQFNLTRFTQTFYIWTPLDVVFGVIMCLLVLEGARRRMGKIVPIFAVFLIFYALFLGPLLPGSWWFGGFSFDRLMGYLFYLSPNGFAGRITGTITTVVGLFLVLGPIVFATGPGKVFMDLAKYIGTKVRGGAAQVSVVSSAAFGTFSGSAISNVATTGVFTIPLMKRAGYTPEQAAAVETIASTGGMLMPPVMGAAIFIMADFLGIPYVTICFYAIIPAILYYICAGAGVYFMGCQRGIPKLPASAAPSLRQIVTFYNFSQIALPMGLLVGLMVAGYTPQFAAAIALLATVAQYLLWGRYSWDDLRKRVLLLIKAMIGGGRGFLLLLVFCTVVQIVVTLIETTGMGVSFSRMVWLAGSQSAFGGVIVTAIVAIILGMGLPSTAIYLIGVAVLGAGLKNLGFAVFPSHFFIFYFGMTAGFTPPVCTALYTGMALAETKKTARAARECLNLGASAYIIPLIFIYDPTLLAIGEPVNIIVGAITGIVGCIAIPAGMVGYSIKPNTLLERLLLFAGGVCLLYPSFLTDGIGAILILLALLSMRFMPASVLIGRRAAEPAMLPTVTLDDQEVEVEPTKEIVD